MRRLWLFYLPLLFLPNLNFSLETNFGVIELSDLLMGPYILLLLHAIDFRRPAQIDRLRPLMFTFLAWACIVTLLINVRYGYSDSFYLQSGLLKLAKFVLYGAAGFLTVKAASAPKARSGLIFSILASALVLGVGLALVGQKSTAHLNTADLNDPGAGYKASNAMSVYAAVLACYICGLWLGNIRKGGGWKKWGMIVAMMVLMLGSAISEGRGGWVAGIAGFIYLTVRGSFGAKRAAILFSVPLIVLVLYSRVPAFHRRVQVTINPDMHSAAQVEDDEDEIGGVSLGARPREWADGVRQFQSPIFGTGFFHRGGNSGIYEAGSHNFFLQMFLETGIPGGCLILAIFVRLWKIGGSRISRDAGFEVPVKAALIAAFVGGMSGEYYYGGVGLVTIFLIYAGCGSLSLQNRRLIPNMIGLEETTPRESPVSLDTVPR